MSSIGGFVLVGVVSDGRGVVLVSVPWPKSVALTHTPQLSFSDMIEVPVPAKSSEEAATIGDGGIEVMVVVGAMVGGTCSGVKTNDESVVGRDSTGSVRESCLEICIVTTPEFHNRYDQSVGEARCLWFCQSEVAEHFLEVLQSLKEK